MTENTITINEVHEFSADIADAVRKLAQLEGHNYKALSDEDFTRMVTSPAVTLFIAQDETGAVVGMVTLIVLRIPYVMKATMEDLSVDESVRGKGIGTMLINAVLAKAQEKGASYLDFTSRPRRESGNNLYDRLGFKKRETNVYRRIFDYQEV